MKAKVTVSLPFTSAPTWLESLDFSTEGDEILIQAVRESGTLLGEIRMTPDDFSTLFGLLVKRG